MRLCQLESMLTRRHLRFSIYVSYSLCPNMRLVLFNNYSDQNRVVHGSDGPTGRVGSGHDFAGFWRVGSGRVSTSDLLVFY